MIEIKLRITNDELIRRLDEIVKKEGFESRNQLINEILALYVGAKDRFVCKVLPPVVNSICTQTINETIESSQKTLESLFTLAKKLSSDASLIATYLELSSQNVKFKE